VQLGTQGRPDRSMAGLAPANGSPAQEEVGFDLRGLAGVRLIGASPTDVAAVGRQLGLVGASLDRDLDFVVRFVDRWMTGSRIRYVGVGEAAFTDDAFLVLGSKHKAPARVEIAFTQIGQSVEIVCEHGLPAVPFLIPILNLTVLAGGVLPLHASAFVHRGTGVVATGWTKGGKDGSAPRVRRAGGGVRGRRVGVRHGRRKPRPRHPGADQDLGLALAAAAPVRGAHQRRGSDTSARDRAVPRCGASPAAGQAGEGAGRRHDPGSLRFSTLSSPWTSNRRGSSGASAHSPRRSTGSSGQRPNTGMSPAALHSARQQPRTRHQGGGAPARRPPGRVLRVPQLLAPPNATSLATEPAFSSSPAKSKGRNAPRMFRTSPTRRLRLSEQHRRDEGRQRAIASGRAASK
jgi:hypothetical protein